MAKKEKVEGAKLYKFVSGGSAYGLGHIPGELVEFKGDENIPGETSIADLLKAGIIVEADEADKVAFEAGQHINAEADKAQAYQEEVRKAQVREQIAALQGQL
jgi:hypothetical protein